MRLLLFTGKGGVGKTTAAAATAVWAARCGIKTLVLSTDAAHSLADTLAVPLTARPAQVEPGLFAAQVDTRARAEQSWRAVQEYLIGVLDALGVDGAVAEELTTLPGAEEVLALLAVRDAVQSGVWDLVVVDCAPTSETLRLLALPEAVTRYLDRALPVERRVARALALAARSGRATTLPAPRDHVVEAAERLRVELTGVREVLTDAGSSVRLVLTPESVVIAETRRTWTTLALHGYGVDAVVVNRLVPAGGDDPWRSGWAQAQAARAREVEDSFGAVPVLRITYAATEPVGPDALASVGCELYGPVGPDAAHGLLAEPGATPGGGDPLRVRRVDAPEGREEYVLDLRLPLADRRQVDLRRVGDDLHVGFEGRERVLALPSGLRRCRVVGAHLRDGLLQVRFEPDPALWRAP